MKTKVSMLFEPILFSYIILSFALLWIANKNSRTVFDIKTGRSKLTILRIVSKRASLDMPYFIPFIFSLFLLVGALFGFRFGGSIYSAIAGSFVGFFMLSILPLCFPMPSTQYCK